MNDFDDFTNKVRSRNLREWLACLVIVPAFFYIGMSKSTLLGKVLCFEIVISALFISYYIFVKSHKRISQTHELSISKRSIINDEISLLSTVKYWYVFPMFFGLAGLSLESLYLDYLRNNSLLGGLLYLTSIIGLSVFIIYLNEFKGVQNLKKLLTS